MEINIVIISAAFAAALCLAVGVIMLLNNNNIFHKWLPHAVLFLGFLNIIDLLNLVINHTYFYDVFKIYYSDVQNSILRLVSLTTPAFIPVLFFGNFKLKAEFRYPKGSNSGIYLRGRYEVQITDNKGMEPSDIYFGGVYGFLEPNQMAAKNAGEWQSYEITLIGNRVTIIANGNSVITDQTIPGITGGAIDSEEDQPGPIMLQGDHGAVEFRSLEIIPIQ